MALSTKRQFLEYKKEYEVRYSGTKDELHELELKKWLKTHRYLDKKNFVKLGLWKSKRVGKHYKRNSDSLIREITRFSFSTKNEPQAIKKPGKPQDFTFVNRSPASAAPSAYKLVVNSGPARQPIG